MIHRYIAVGCLVLGGISAPLLAGVAPEQAEIAERFLQTGQRLVQANYGAPVAMALADVAERMFENDPRLLREAIDLRMSLGQRDAAIKLLSAYRRLDPADQVAQVQSIDLITDGLQTADQKADYLAKVADSAAVAPEIRAHASLLRVGVETQRGRDDEAEKALAAVLRLDPLNRRALQVQLDNVTRTGDAVAQSRALVSLLMAEPTQFGGYARLAETLARNGASIQAGELYNQLFRALATTDYDPTPDDSYNYASLLLADNKPKEALAVVDAALKIDPTQARGHYLRILCAWQAKNEADAKASLDTARQQLLQNLAGLQNTSADPKTIDGTFAKLPDVAAVVKKLAENHDARASGDYLQALGDLAWLDVYFGARAPDPAVMSGIEALGGANAVLLNRTAGFAALAAGHDDDAKVKFAAVADRDPLSELGLLVVQSKSGADKAMIQSAANGLIEKLPIDAWAAMVRWSLRDIATPTFRAPIADGIIAEAAKLPREWINFTRDGRAFYFATVDVVKANVQIGEPMVVTVTLQNSSTLPLTIGPGGAIESGIPLDANVRGAAERAFPAIAVAKITGKIVLRPKEQTRVTVRLDDSALDSFSASNPQTGMSVFVSALTNPVVRNRTLAPGAGGMRAQARNVIDRPPIPYRQEPIRSKLTAQLRSDKAIDRLHAVTTIGACAQWLSGTTPDDKPLVIDATSQIRQAADHDASSTVRSVALLRWMLLQEEADRSKALQAMLSSPDLEARVLGCLTTLNRPQAERKDLLAALSTDADAAVSQLAKAIIDLPDPPAPASQPLETQP